MATVGGCSAGLIAQWFDASGWEVLAWRGLGAEPLRTLHGVQGGIAMLSAAVKQACWVTHGGEQVTWEPGSTLGNSARARQARTRLTAGIACPIVLGMDAVGVVALYGRQTRLTAPECRRLVVSVAQALAPVVARRRAPGG